MRLMLSVLLLLVQACATAPQKAPAKKAKPVAIAKPKPIIKKPAGLQLKKTIKRDPELPSEFFAMTKGALVLGVRYCEESLKEGSHFQTWLKDKTVFWRTEPVEKLASLGLKKGDVIQYLDFESNTVRQYVIKEKVNLVMIDYEERSQTDEEPYRTFHLWPNDVIDESDYPGNSDSDYVTGIAYKGSEYKLRPNSLTFIPEHASIPIDDKEVQEIYKVVKKTLSDKENNKQQYGDEIEEEPQENIELYLVGARLRVVGPITDFSLALNHKKFPTRFDWSYAGFETIVRVGENSLYNVTYNDPNYETRDVDGILSYKNILEGADMVFFEEEYSNSLPDICSSIFIVKGDVIEQNYLKCRNSH
jgi:hypothetical protein